MNLFFWSVVFKSNLFYWTILFLQASLIVLHDAELPWLFAQLHNSKNFTHVNKKMSAENIICSITFYVVSLVIIFNSIFISCQC